MEIYITADTHFSHVNVLEYDQRPFSSVDEMNEVLIENWNTQVMKKDIVYHLGDFAFHSNSEKIAALLKRLHGKVVLIRGNHDYKLSKHTLSLFHDVKDFFILRDQKRRLVLSHYPFETWYRQSYQAMGGVHLHGHSHGRLGAKLNRLDAGCMNWRYSPLHINTAIEQARHAIST